MTNTQMVGVGVAAVVTALFLSYKAGEAAKDLGNAINPTNPDNIFYTGVNAVGESITGDEHWTLGAAIYEWTHDEQ